MSESIVAVIAEIQTLGLAELRDRWRALYGTDCPRYSRTYLIQRLCYRVQELRFGGLSEVTRARLRDALPSAERAGPDGKIAPLKPRKRENGLPVPGTRITRQWHGVRHEVVVTADGFEYGGKLYRSLTAVATAITNQHWSGRLFFGLRDRKARKT